MKKNVGSFDRGFRVILGLGLIAFALTAEGTTARFGWLGIVPLLTAVASFCPVYTLLGINTCQMKK